MILLQDEFKEDPWKMLVCCVLLNRTKGTTVKKIIYALFEKYPYAYAMSQADPSELAELLRPLGFQNRRAKTLIKLSEKCCSAGWKDRVDELPGGGKYAVDSWEIFQKGSLDIEVEDKELRKYLEDRR